MEINKFNNSHEENNVLPGYTFLEWKNIGLVRKFENISKQRGEYYSKLIVKINTNEKYIDSLQRSFLSVLNGKK